jgi:hypothetical protein
MHFQPEAALPGDRAYDAVDFMRMIKARGAIPAIRVKRGRLKAVRNPERMASRADTGSLASDGTLIEGLLAT